MRLTANRALVAAAAVLAAVAGAQQVYIASRPEPAEVLHYPVQRVLSRVGGSDRPSVRLGQDIEVRGTKCNDSTTPVPISGVTSWVSLDPPGTVIETGHGATVRAPGCSTRTYSNPIPELVAARTRAIAAATSAPCVTWMVAGVETPTNPLILAAQWQSEPVDICV